MTFSFSGLAYLIGFFAVGLLTYKFFQYWQKEKSVISKLFFYFTASSSFYMFVTAIAGLFFADNTQILKNTVIFDAFIQSFSLAVVGYIIVYLKFPQISPWFGAVPVFLLGMVATVLTAIIPFNPYLEPSGGINWDVQPLADVVRSILFFITFIPLIIILIQQIKTSEDILVKRRSFLIVLALVFGTLIGVFDFFLENMMNLEAVTSDIAMSFLSFIIIILIFQAQKTPSLPDVKKNYEK